MLRPEALHALQGWFNQESERSRHTRVSQQENNYEDMFLYPEQSGSRPGVFDDAAHRCRKTGRRTNRRVSG